MQSTAEIIKLAILNEVRARTFYGKAADLARDGEAQMVFMELIEMEDQHARRLVNAFGPTLSEAGTDGEAYLAEITADVEKTLESDQLALLENAELRPVIEFAMGMEEKARDAYLGLKTKVEGGALQELCQELADEEQAHYDQLAEARIGVDTPPDERPML